MPMDLIPIGFGAEGLIPVGLSPLANSMAVRLKKSSIRPGICY